MPIVPTGFNDLLNMIDSPFIRRIIVDFHSVIFIIPKVFLKLFGCDININKWSVQRQLSATRNQKKKKRLGFKNL